MLTDYHTHNSLCRHAVGDPADYAEAAISAGLAEIGFSDHSPMPEEFDDWRMLIDEFPRYLDLVEAAREQFPDFPIRLGLEVDYFPGGEPWIEKLVGMADWDYLIGAVHYISDDWDVDNPKHLSRYETTGVDEVWELYWRRYAECVRSGLFDFYAHPDLAKKFGHRPGGDLKKFYAPAIQAAVDTNAAFEINTAGLHKEVAELYPATGFLEMMHEAEIPVLINSDAHEPGHVGRDFSKALRTAREVGFTKTIRFEKRQRRIVDLPDSL